MSRSRWGAIRQLPSGRWQAKYRDDAGRWTPAPSTFDFKEDAEAWLDAKRTDLRRGVDIDDRAARKPVSHWWPVMDADSQRRLKPSTVRYYRDCWADHVEPRFGGTAVARIRPSDVDRWLGDLIDAGVSPSRVRGALGVLSRLLDTALRDRAISTNPAAARRERIPMSQPAERPVLSPEEVAMLHDAADCEVNGKPKGSAALACLVSVLAWGGLRIGEALSLQRRDVDLKRGTITVRRSVDGEMNVTGTKTGRQRTVTLPPSVTAELRTHLADVPIQPDAWLFPSRNGTPLRYGSFRRWRWNPLLTRFNAARVAAKLDPVDVMPHDLRSSCASLLIDAGASPKDVQAHLGHADISTTLNLYARVRPGRADDLAARMDALIGSGQG